MEVKKDNKKRLKTRDEYKPRADNVRNKMKVMREVLKDPLLTQREIAKKTGIWLWNVNRKLRELEQSGTKLPTIEEICQQDIEIVKLSNQVRGAFVAQIIDKIPLQQHFKNKDWDLLNQAWYVNNAELAILNEGQDNEYYGSVIEVINSRVNISREDAMAVDRISDTSHKRYSLLKGNATDEAWWLKQLSELPIEELWVRFKTLDDKQNNGIDWERIDWEGDFEEEDSWS